MPQLAKKYYIDSFQTDDRQKVKDVLTSIISKKSQFKGKFFYQLLIKIFDKYPETCKQLIDQLPDVTNYKNYLYLLKFSDKENLNTYVYDRIVKQIKKDTMSIHISDLARWLPREDSSYDKKLNFVAKIAPKLFPDNNLPAAKRKYRKMRVELTKKLNTIEPKLCTKDYDAINFEDLNRKTIKRYNNAFIRTPSLSDRYRDYIYIKYRELPLLHLIQKIRYNNTKKMNEFEKGIISQVWNVNKKSINLPASFENKELLIDFSNELCKRENMCFVLLIALLYLDTNTKIIIHKNTPVNFASTMSIFEKIDLIMSNLRYCKDHIHDCENTVILTTSNNQKTINNCTIWNICWQPFTMKNIGNNKYLTGNTFYREKKIKHKEENKDLDKFKKVINKSEELRTSKDMFFSYLPLLSMYIILVLISGIYVYNR